MMMMMMMMMMMNLFFSKSQPMKMCQDCHCLGPDLRCPCFMSMLCAHVLCPCFVWTVSNEVLL